MTTPTGAPSASQPTATPQASGTATPKRRGRKPGSVAKERPAIPADQFKVSSLDQVEKGEMRRKREERSAQQIATDKLAIAVHKQWVGMGSPRDWSKMPIKLWVLDRNLEDSAEFLLRKAATLYGFKLVFGQRGVYKEGKVHLAFCFIDRKAKVEGSGNDEANDSDE